MRNEWYADVSRRRWPLRFLETSGMRLSTERRNNPEGRNLQPHPFENVEIRKCEVVSLVDSSGRAV